MSVKALSDYTQYAKYAKYIKERKRRETWGEQADRVFQMHYDKLGEDVVKSIQEDFDFAKDFLRKKKVLGSQRALQFGGDPILKKNAKIYNCTASYADRVRFFQECMYLLLCGCGTGVSIQKHHVAKLPEITTHSTKVDWVYKIPDSIEGWADAIGVLVNTYFNTNDAFITYDKQNLGIISGTNVEFDYNLIRPEGSALSWGGIAPGPEGLKNAIRKIKSIFDSALMQGQNKIHSIQVYDIIMHISDAVLSGGIRRSAVICIFSPDDEEMINAKTGSWFIDNPQRGRSNNSALLIRNETTKPQFSRLMKSVKEFGEPGFIWADDKETIFNPCSEIGLYAYNDEGISGWEFCNLCEINGKKAISEQMFLDQCKTAAILGTIQASYDKFDYLTQATHDIVKKEALLGISITGMMDNPDILFNPDIQRKGAQLILDTNERIAKLIGINPAARTTCIKPAGSTSCVLGTASGIHPHHAKRYMRRVQANRFEFPVQHFAKYNPDAVKESVWSSNNTDQVITFLCEVPDGSKTKNQVNALQLLEYVKLTQQNWVEYGTRRKDFFIRHNVSNTINVKPDEWGDVEDFIFNNRQWFAGISLLSHSGDLDYNQAPFISVLNERELVQEYGEGCPLASGLVVDALKAFKNDLWKACDCALGIGEVLTKPEEPKEPIMPVKNGYSTKEYTSKLTKYSTDLSQFYISLESYNNILSKIDWVRRFKQFAERYCNSDYKKCSHMLKHITIWKEWLDLKRSYVDIDWSQVIEDVYQVDVSSIGGEACAGGRCEIGDLGARIAESKQNKHK